MDGCRAPAYVSNNTAKLPRVVIPSWTARVDGNDTKSSGLLGAGGNVRRERGAHTRELGSGGLEKAMIGSGVGYLDNTRW